MRPRRLFLAFLAAFAAAAAAWRRRRRGRRYVELHYDDGSMVRLEEGNAADDLLALARRAVREAGVA